MLVFKLKGARIFDVNIRIATIEDLVTVQNLNKELYYNENKYFDYTVNPDFSTTTEGETYFRECIQNEKNVVLIAEEDGKPAGYIVGVLQKIDNFRNITSLGEVSSLLVDEKYRGMGVGKMLIDGFKKWCKEKDVKRIRVIASFGNKKAIDFYKREGFGDWELVMESDLS